MRYLLVDAEILTVDYVTLNGWNSKSEGLVVGLVSYHCILGKGSRLCSTQNK